MKDIVLKMNRIKDIFDSSKSFGDIILFALILRTDNEIGKWDLVISGSTVLENNSTDNLKLVIENLKLEFKEKIDFLSQIHILMPKEWVVSKIRSSLKEDIDSPEEFCDLIIDDTFTIGQIHVFKSVFMIFEEEPQKVNLKEEEGKDDFE